MTEVPYSSHIVRFERPPKFPFEERTDKIVPGQGLVVISMPVRVDLLPEPGIQFLDFLVSFFFGDL